MDKKSLFRCNMMHILFVILAVVYLIQVNFMKDFEPVGKEFANLVILGLLLIIMKNGDKT